MRFGSKGLQARKAGQRQYQQSGKRPHAGPLCPNCDANQLPFVEIIGQLIRRLICLSAAGG
jgi:hypothetical protein